MASCQKTMTQTQKRGFAFAHKTDGLCQQFWQPVHGLHGSAEPISTSVKELES